MEQTHSVYEVKDPDLRSSWRFRTSWNMQESVFHSTGYQAQIERFRWYLEEYPLTEPCSSSKMIEVERELEEYGQRLAASFVKDLPVASDSRVVLLDVHDCDDKSSVHALPWELLEDTRISCGRQIVVRRRAAQHAVTVLNSSVPKTFNILLLAQPSTGVPGKDAPYRQAATPILQLLQNLPDGAPVVSLEMVRPGTYKALLKHLEDARIRGHVFHLVHLDMHGEVSRKHRCVNIFFQFPACHRFQF